MPNNHIFQNGKTILALSPHTDDAELGCGGTLARLAEEGMTVHYAAFSICEESLPVGFEKNILEKECKKATQSLGIPGDRVTIHRYPVRKFSYHRQDILEDLIKLKKTVNPDVVLTCSPNDFHQDHEVLFNESLRAFKNRTLLAYELPWNQNKLVSHIFVHLTEAQVMKKIESIQCYESQLAKKRNYTYPNLIKSLAQTRGISVDSVYAECFEVIRFIFE